MHDGDLGVEDFLAIHVVILSAAYLHDELQRDFFEQIINKTKIDKEFIILFEMIMVFEYRPSLRRNFDISNELMFAAEKKLYEGLYSHRMNLHEILPIPLIKDKQKESEVLQKLKKSFARKEYQIKTSSALVITQLELQQLMPNIRLLGDLSKKNNMN